MRMSYIADVNKKYEYQFLDIQGRNFYTNKAENCTKTLEINYRCILILYNHVLQIHVMLMKHST